MPVYFPIAIAGRIEQKISGLVFLVDAGRRAASAGPVAVSGRG
jgi:hypothetical protein